MIECIVLFIYLCVMTVYDIRRQEIQLEVSAVVAIGLTIRQISRVLCGEISWYLAFGGIVIGLILIAISICTRGQIGIGDGIVFVISGLPLGFYENSLLLLAALSLAAVFGVVKTALGGMKRKAVFPFVPCICAAYGVICVWKILEFA